MFDNSIVNKTSPEPNWNRQTGGWTGGWTGRRTGRQTDGQKSQADALTKKKWAKVDYVI